MSGSLNAPKSKAADLLLRAQLIARDRYEQVMGLVQRNGIRAEEIILEQDLMSEADLLKALSGIYRTHFVSTDKLARADIPRSTIQMIPRRVAETLGVFPVLFDQASSVLGIVTADPDNGEILREVKLVSGARDVKAFVARPAAVLAAIRKHHGGDTRAFDQFSRAGLSYDWGQQFSEDGVHASKEAARRATELAHQQVRRGETGPQALSSGDFILERTPDPQRPPPPKAPPPVPQAKRPSYEEDDAMMRHAGRRSSPEPTELEPPPLPPNHQGAANRAAKRTGPQVSLSVPPPPGPPSGGAGGLAPPSREEEEDFFAPPRPARAAPPAMQATQATQGTGRSERSSERDLAVGPKAARTPAQAAASRAPADPGATGRRKALPRNDDDDLSQSLLVDSVPPRGVLSSSSSSIQPDSRTAFTSDTTIELITVMVSLLENSRQELRGHSSQVARLLKRVAERMHLERADAYAVIFAGHIHDIGKMGQFHLTALNCSEYEGHRIAAQKACDTPLRLLEAVRLPAAIKNAVLHMYERFDGKGFPDKLGGKDIPLGARLLAVADTYADLTQNPRNPFRKVLSAAEAMNVLMKHKSTIFDPGILDLFKALVLGEDMKAKLLANRYRALVVDSDPEESTVLELRMVEQGFDVKTARTVDAARKLLSDGEAEFDLVVCELELPDADGLAFLSEARRESWGRDIPWVVHTHKQGRTEAQRAFELGAKDFVAKPVQADVLVAKLKAMLEQRPSTTKSAKGVSGSLREMGLPDIVQVLFHGRKNGKLELSFDGKGGEIHFLEGQIANALLGELSGASAFYAMLKFQDGEFALDPSFKPGERAIQESAEALLLEGMRRMDEGI